MAPRSELGIGSAYPAVTMSRSGRTHRVIPGVVVVTDADAPSGRGEARVLAGTGTAAVLCGHDALALGELASELETLDVQVGIFVGDPSTDGETLTEMVRELYPVTDS